MQDFFDREVQLLKYIRHKPYYHSIPGLYPI